MVRSFRSLVIWFLAFWNGLDLKQLGARLGLSGKRVSEILAGGEIADRHFAPLLTAAARRPAEVQVVHRCLADLASLREAGDLSDAEQEEVERGLREASHLLRRAFVEGARLSRNLPPFDDYPQPGQLEAARWHADQLWAVLEEMTEEQRLAVVRHCREGRTWWLMERVCAAAVEAASRNLDQAASLARLAVAIAERVQGPEGWCRRVLGYATAHPPNVLRVAGKLQEARAGIEPAKQLWEAGWDPGHVLDPGRLLGIEASLCRAEREFDQALTLLDQAVPVSHNPGRILIKKGHTLEVLGDDEGAIRALTRAIPLVENQGDSRLLYMARFNLAAACTRRGRFKAAAGLARQVREIIDKRGDANEAPRLHWLEGRIAAGLGRPEEAHALLELAAQQFADRQMWYDVALARQDLAGLLLDEGRFSEVEALARELVETFEAKGVHPEALAALRLFHAAAAREEATAALAHRIGGYLQRARHDPGLQYTDSPAPGAAVGVHPAAFVDHGLRVADPTPAAGVHTAAFRRDLKQAAGSQEEGEEGGKENRAHGELSGAAPAAGLHGPRGPRLPAILRQNRGKNPPAVAVDRQLNLGQRLSRLFRAVSGLSQLEFGAKIGIFPSLLDRYEQGKVNPSAEHLRLQGEGVDLTVAAGEEILHFADVLRRPQQRPGLGRAALFQATGALANRVAERLLRLPPGGPDPKPQDRDHASELWARLEPLPAEQQVAVVRVGREYQNWALAEKCCAGSVKQVSRDLDRAASLARLAREIATRISGPESWLLYVEGYAAGHLPNVQRVQGELVAAREGMEEAKQLHLAGDDPWHLLDPGRLLDLEASLCRAERQPEKALTLLDEAFPVSHSQGRILIKKGYILVVMGDYGRALETFLAAEPLVEREGDPRLTYMLLFNTAVVHTHLGRFAAAGPLVQRVSELVGADEGEACRILWLRGRIAAGLGRPMEAQRLLGEARRAFAARDMWYDVALADLEIAPFLLAEGSTEEVKAMATELVEAFRKRGVHPEAEKALQLFKDAADKEEATAELAGKVLRYLFRAEHQPELAFAA